MAFSNDDRFMAAGSGNRVLSVWPMNVQAWRTKACEIAGRNLTREEWRKYMGDQPYHRTCPELPGPDDARQAAAIQAPPGVGKAPSAESAPTEAAGPALTAPPSHTQPENPTAPAPVQEGDPVKPVDAEDRARIGPTPVQTISPVPPASGNN